MRTATIPNFIIGGEEVLKNQSSSSILHYRDVHNKNYAPKVHAGPFITIFF
jgi:hypothetical protein